MATQTVNRTATGLRINKVISDELMRERVINQVMQFEGAQATESIIQKAELLVRYIKRGVKR